MGCDIHCFIEYSKPDWDQWSDFGGRINPGRNYELFSLLAGIRGDTPPLFEPRGMVTDPAHTSADENQLYISEEKEAGFVSAATAARYVLNGARYINDNEGKPAWVTHPDWHTHSWLTTSEFERVLDDHDIRCPGQSEIEYRAILGSMQVFEAAGYRARLVFWFDN